MGKLTKDEKPTSNHEVLIDQLSSQYKIYRDEVRGFLQLAGGSASLLVILLFGEITAAKDNPLLLFLVPLSIVSYGALFALMFIYASIAASYSELLEKKLNALLHNQSRTYIFESEYVGPKPKQREFIYFGLIWTLIPVMPLSVCAYALWQLRKSYKITSELLALIVVIGLLGMLFSTVKIMLNRKQRNKIIIDEMK
jgi:hypothetical protein